MFLLIVAVGVFSYCSIYLVSFLIFDCDLQTALCEKFGKSLSRLRGKVVFITGASSGIGEFTAIALAKQGAKLVLTARRKNELDRVKLACLGASNGLLSDEDILVIPMDITDLSLHKQNFDYAVRYFNNVDILFNNAGRSQRAVFENIEMGVDKQMFELNVFAVVNLTRIAVNYFNKTGKGHVAVVSSLAGIIGVPFSATYTGSKHALHGYFNALRAEKVGRKLTVTMICPGPTYTNFLSESFTDKEHQKHGISAKATDKRLTAERCGQLCAVALVNQLSESWMGLLPTMPFTYLVVYYPLLYRLALNTVGPERLFRMRDSQEIKLNQVQVV